nr:hypothetical protein [uncultured Draconibacterium sp.]
MESKFELTGVVELFGHQKIAGTISEHGIGSSTFVRIDVPETKSQPKFTRFVNPSAVYAINPTDKETMLYMVENIAAKPIDSWDIQEMHQKILALNAGKSQSSI